MEQPSGPPGGDHQRRLDLAMYIGKHPLTPLAAVIGGLLAGAVGTVCLDTVAYFWLFTLQEDDLGSVMINGLLQSEDPRNKQH